MYFYILYESVCVIYFIMFYFFFFKVKDGLWGKIVFEVKMKKINRLLIVDVGIVDIGQ